MARSLLASTSALILCGTIGIGEALAGTAGFAAGAALGQILIPIPILGGLIGGILGDMLLKKMFGFAKKFLGKLFGKKDKELEKSVKVTNGGVGMTSSEKTYTKAEIEALNWSKFRRFW